MRNSTSITRTRGRRYSSSATATRPALRLISGGSEATLAVEHSFSLDERTPLRLVPLREVPTVLIADSDEDVLSLLGFALSSEFEVLRASDGEQALRLALTEQPDLIVLGVRMPKLDGYQVTVQIRRNLATSDIPVILLDNHPERIDTLRGFAAGANDYIATPLDPVKLLARIQDTLEASEPVG